MDSILEEGLCKLGLLQDRSLALLTRYVEEIELFNTAYGLVKVRDRRELIVKHIIDSLAPLSLIGSIVSKTARIADVGSGAGLPGIPLAVCMPDAEFTLIERMGRRAGFLRNVLAVLGLSNARVEEKEMEKFSASSSKRFDLVVFRAFRPLETGVLKKLFGFLAPGGLLAAYKGRRQTVEEEMAGIPGAAKKNNAAGSLETISWEIFPLEVPFLEEERHLLLIRSA